MSHTTLAAAFRATTYRVATPAACFALRVGVINRAFDEFLGRQPAARQCSVGGDDGGAVATICWGIVTAYNPGVPLADEENRRRQGHLGERIAARGWPFFNACNLADGGVWPEEPSFLVLHADAEQMRALGSEFRQLAVVYGCTGSAPRLLWI